MEKSEEGLHPARNSGRGSQRQDIEHYFSVVPAQYIHHTDSSFQHFETKTQLARNGVLLRFPGISTVQDRNGVHLWGYGERGKPKTATYFKLRPSLSLQ